MKTNATPRKCQSDIVGSSVDMFDRASCGKKASHVIHAELGDIFLCTTHAKQKRWVKSKPAVMGELMANGYCENCPNPIECYQLGRCWPPDKSTNQDMKMDLKKLWAAMPRDVQMKISCYDLQRITDNYNGETGPTSESQRAAAEIDDEAPIRQAENAIGEARAESATSPKRPTQ